MANATYFWNGTGSSFLEFTALQLWQVRLLMYSSERPNTRATHIQCWSSSTSGWCRWSLAKPCQPSKRRDHFGFCWPHHDGRKCFRSSRSLSLPLAVAQSLFLLSPSDRDSAGLPSIGSPVEEGGRPGTTPPPTVQTRLPSSIFHLPPFVHLVH